MRDWWLRAGEGVAQAAGNEVLCPYGPAYEHPKQNACKIEKQSCDQDGGTVFVCVCVCVCGEHQNILFWDNPETGLIRWPVFCKQKGTPVAVKSIHRKEYKELLAALVQARRDAGMTQAELAKKLKKPQSYISKIENGERRLDVIELMEVTKTLGFDYRNLL